MSHFTGNRLYDLLPGIYRKRDLEGDQALRQLCDVVYEEILRSDQQIRDLYESWFVETCPDEVVPHIAALLGFHMEADPSGFPTHRAMVANAMSNRLAKGTVHALEQGAAEASGWAVEVVEFFERMAANAPMQSSRGRSSLHREASVYSEPDASVGRTVDIRRRSDDGARGGGGNLQEIELRVARMRACPVENVACRSDGQGRFRLHPLNLDVPVFHQHCHDPVVELSHGLTRLPVQMEQATVQGDLARHMAHARRRAESPPVQTSWLGPGRSLALRVDGEAVPAWQMEVCDLSEWRRPGPSLEGWRTGPMTLAFAVDSPALRLERDGFPSRKLRLSRQPGSRADAARLLRSAIRRLGPESVYRDCEVVAFDDVLMVFLGERVHASSWRFAPASDDPATWTALGFDAASMSSALLSAEVDWEWSAPASTGLLVAAGDTAPIEVDVPMERGELERVADAMQAVLRDHGDWHVMNLGEHLLLLPPRDQARTRIRVRSSGRDRRALRVLGLGWKLGLDPVLGRVQLPLGFDDCQVHADWAFGSLMALGGGPFGRDMVGPDDRDDLWCAVVSQGYPQDSAGRYRSLETAVRAWKASQRAHQTDAYIRVLDSAVYRPSSGVGLTLQLDGRTLTIEAADGEQPAIVGDLEVWPGGGSLQLVGLLHDGQTALRSGGSVTLRHVTSRGDLTVAATDAPLSLHAERCILGSVRFASLFGRAAFHDCVLGSEAGVGLAGGGPHEHAPSASFFRSTVLGEVCVGELTDAQDSLFIGRVMVRRRHVGSIRSCAVPAQSSTCRRDHCFEFWAEDSPTDESLVKDSLPPPSFVSLRFGDPGFAQLAAETNANFRSGASNGHELGVYNTVRQHDRTRFLRASVHEYLPVGWWADIQFVN